MPRCRTRWYIPQWHSQSLGLDIAVYTDEGVEVDLMQDVNPRRSTPNRPTYESLGVADFDDD